MFEELNKKKNFQKKLDGLANEYENKKLAIYGAGTFADYIFQNFNLSRHNIICVADKKFKTENEEIYFGKKAVSPYFLKDAEIDAVLCLSVYTEPIIDYLEDEILIDCPNSDVEILKLV